MLRCILLLPNIILVIHYFSNWLFGFRLQLQVIFSIHLGKILCSTKII